MVRFMCPNSKRTPHMAMAITMRIVAQIHFFAARFSQGQGPSSLLSVHYADIKGPPNSRCVFRGGFENTTKIMPHTHSGGQLAKEYA